MIHYQFSESDRRGIIEDEPLPWQKPQPMEKLTPGRVAQGFSYQILLSNPSYLLEEAGGRGQEAEGFSAFRLSILKGGI